MKLKDCHNFYDFRKLAKKKLPSPIFHYIDGAADDEITYKRNTSAFNDFKTFDALNSFYDEKFVANEDKQIKNLKKFINKWRGDKNLVLVTHYVVINSILGVGSGSGEIVVVDKNLILQGRISNY